MTGRELKAADVTNSASYPPPSGCLGFVLPLATFLQNPTSLAPLSPVKVEERCFLSNQNLPESS